MKQNIIFIFFALNLLGFVSCDKEELEATVPAYLRINDINVITTDPKQGSASDNIKDAWVFIDDELIGAYELPAVIPILKTGKINLKVRGGIHVNGLSNIRDVYPYYEFYDTTLTLVAEQIIQPDINVTYKVNTIFDDVWSGEDFESGVNFIGNSDADVSLRRTTDKAEVFEGIASGKATVPSNRTKFEVYTPSISTIRRSGSQAFLEFDYKASHDFKVSLYINNRLDQTTVIDLRAKSIWNKVYIDLGSVFSNYPSALDFNIAIGYQTEGSEEGNLFLDNVKLLHF